MGLIFNFVAVKCIQIDLLLKTLTDYLSKEAALNENLYVSILPTIDSLSLIEFADFIPVARYRDIDAGEFVQALSRSFNTVYLFEKNEQSQKSKYRKFIKGELEKEYKGSDALEKGLKYDLVLDYNEFVKHVRTVWEQNSDPQKKQPVVYQIIKNGQLMKKPVELNPIEYYGHTMKKTP